jgi:ribonuclease HI
MILLHLSKSPSTQRREPKPLPSWASPPDVTAVINVDAALFSSSGRMGVGVVIRSHSGDFLSACSQILDAVTVPELAEAFAVRHAVTLARNEGLDRIIVLPDCLSLVQRINSSSHDRWLELW